LWLREVLLNRIVHPYVQCNLGFRALEVGEDIDLVHIHTHPTVLRGLGRRPVVFSAGSSHYHWLRDYEKWSETRIEAAYARARVVYRRFGILDALLNDERITLSYTFSENAREVYLAHGVPEWKIRVVYPGFDIPEKSRSTEKELRYLFLGRDPRRKGGDIVLSAFQRLRRSRPEARLLYVCDELPPSPIPGVETSPLVAYSEVASLYRRAQVFVNPTRAEGFGFTNVEAQGFGLPVISTRLGAIPEVVEDGQTGILVPPDDETAVFEAMRRLAEDHELRSRMSAAARKRFTALFSMEVFRSAIAAIYDEALERARSR
jgi:glycosyltransferase involved in cell wall biosynthesis